MCCACVMCTTRHQLHVIYKCTHYVLHCPQWLHTYNTSTKDGNLVKCSGYAKTTLLHLKPHFDETASAQHSGCVVCALPLLLTSWLHLQTHCTNMCKACSSKPHGMNECAIRCPSRVHACTAWEYAHGSNYSCLCTLNGCCINVIIMQIVIIMQTPYSQHSVITAWNFWWVIQVCPVHKHSTCCNLISTLCVAYITVHLNSYIQHTHLRGIRSTAVVVPKQPYCIWSPISMRQLLHNTAAVWCVFFHCFTYNNIEHCMLWMPIGCPSRMHARTNAHTHSHTAWSRISSQQELVMLAHIKRLLYYSCRSHIASTVLQLHGTPDGSFKSVLFTNTAAAAI